jgi:proline iminopeptidase
LGGERYGKKNYTDWVFHMIDAPEYSFADIIRWSKGAAFTAGHMGNDSAFRHFHFFTDIPKVPVPVIFISGAHDYNTP